MVLLLDDGPIEVSGTVATVREVPGGEGWAVGIDFDPLGPAVADAIVSWCFRFPFGPDCAVMPVRAPLSPPREDGRRAGPRRGADAGRRRDRRRGRCAGRRRGARGRRR